MKLLIKIPTRERGFDWLEKYVNNIELPETEIYLTLDNDCPILPEWIIESEKVFCIVGETQNKIHAYNRDIEKISHNWDVILVGSDDMEPKVKGFDRVILQDMERYFPDTDGCLWYDTEDQHALKHIAAAKGSQKFLNRAICMLPIMGRKYYERFGYIYNPSYTAFWCDNEQTRVAQRLKKIQYIDNRIIEHQHPSWGAAMPNDDLYMRNNKYFRDDMKIYNQRARHGFSKA